MIAADGRNSYLIEPSRADRAILALEMPRGTLPSPSLDKLPAAGVDNIAMWYPLARYLICPLHEQLLRRPTFRYAAELEHSQWLSPAEVRQLQQHRLQAMLQFAYSQVPYYQACMKERGIEPHCDDPLAALRAMPTLSRATLRDHQDNMLSRTTPHGLVASCTGGSTGEPVQFFVDRQRQASDQALRIRTHRWFGVDIGHRELYLWGSPIEAARLDEARRLRDALFNHRLVSAFHMSPQRMTDYWQTLRRFDPVSLYGYPSSLCLLAEHAKQAGLHKVPPSLRAIFVTGERCYPHQRELLSSVFNARVADGYGSRDGGLIAHECPHGSMHVMSEHLYVEILDGDAPVASGDTGEIVITHLYNHAQPLIRYRTGDMGRIRPGRCACGRGLPMLEAIEGRTTDNLHLPDGTIKHALSLIYPLREMTGVGRFRAVQQADYSLTIDVEPADASNPPRAARIQQAVAHAMGNAIPVRVNIVEHIHTTPSGKHRYVISHVGQRDAASIEANDASDALRTRREVAHV